MLPSTLVPSSALHITIHVLYHLVMQNDRRCTEYASSYCWFLPGQYRAAMNQQCGPPAPHSLLHSHQARSSPRLHHLNSCSKLGPASLSLLDDKGVEQHLPDPSFPLRMTQETNPCQRKGNSIQHSERELSPALRVALIVGCFYLRVSYSPNNNKSTLLFRTLEMHGSFTEPRSTRFRM